MDSPEDAALEALRNALHPQQLLAVLNADPNSRSFSMVEALARDAAHEADETVAELRAHQASELARLLVSVDTASRVFNLGQYVELAKQEPFALAAEFWQVIRSVASDVVDETTQIRADGLRRCLAVRDELLATIERLNEFLAGVDKQSTVPAEFLDEGILEWLRVYQLATLESDPDAASHVAQVREFLITTRNIRLVRVVEGPSGAEVRFPSDDLAEVWDRAHPDLDAQYAMLARELGDPILSVEECLFRAMDIVGATSPSEKVYFSAYFLQAVLRDITTERLPEVLDCYRSLIGTSGLGALENATVSLRYCVALNLHWSRLDRAVFFLEDALAHLDRALTTVPAERAMFVRDLHFARARVAENLGTWQPERLDEAASSLESGLSIVDANHGRAVRGRALGDLGNVLGKLAARRGGVSWARVDAAFNEALSLLSEPARWSRAVVLSNFAVSLMDRPGGDRATNLEKALKLADQALAAAAEVSDKTRWMKESHAGMHLTRGNAIRERYYGGRRARLLAAREAFIAGQRVAPDESHISGLLRLNQALVASELAPHDPAGSFAEEANRCFESARTTITNDPVAAAVAEFAEVMRGDVDTIALDTARRALQRLATLGVAREVGWRALFLARRLASLESQHWSEAGELLGLSLTQFRVLEDIEGIVDVEREMAALDMRGGPTPTREQLERAERHLEAAREAAERLWRSLPTIEWRLSHPQVSDVFAELVWVRTALGAPVDEVIAASCLAKEREFLEHTRLLMHPRADTGAIGAGGAARSLEMQRWRAQADAGPTEPVFDLISSTNDAIAEARLTEAILGGPREEMLASAVRGRLDNVFESHPDAVVLDLTSSKWGTVALIIQRGRSQAAAVPLSLSALAELVEKPSGWAFAHRAWQQAGDINRSSSWNDWEAKTHELLECLRRFLAQPILDELTTACSGDRTLFIVAGALSGLPIHAIPTTGSKRIIDHPRAVAYVATIARLPRSAVCWRPPADVLCILSDPPHEGRGALSASPEEIARIARRLGQRGAFVTMLAAAGGAVGVDSHPALRSDGLPKEALAPSPENLIGLLPLVDAVVFSGHATSSELLLADSKGAPAQLPLEELMALEGLPLRPFVHLSACSTAEGGDLGPDVINLASCFLRIGASGVVAGLWELRDSQSARFSEALYCGAEDGVQIAAMVADAVSAVRESAGDDAVLTWAPFVLLLGPN